MTIDEAVALSLASRLSRYGLRGRRALVVGGATGLGPAIVSAFARAGADVLIADLDEEAADETAHALRYHDGLVVGIGIDVTEEARADDLIGHAVGTFDGLDILVNGTGHLAAVRAASEAFLAYQKGRRDGGTVVNVAGARGRIHTYTKAFAADAFPHGVRVNGVIPGAHPEDTVATTVFLASDAAALVAGEVVLVDGHPLPDPA